MCPKCSSLEVTKNATGENVCDQCGHLIDSPNKAAAASPETASSAGQATRKKTAKGALMTIIGSAICILAIFAVHHHQKVVQYEYGPYDFEDASGWHVGPAYREVCARLVAPKTASLAEGLYKTNEEFVTVKLTIDSQNIYGANVRSEWGVEMKYHSFGITNDETGWWADLDCRQLSGPSSVRK